MALLGEFPAAMCHQHWFWGADAAGRCSLSSLCPHEAGLEGTHQLSLVRMIH